MSEEKELERFFIQLLGCSLAFIVIFLLSMGLMLIINSALIGVTLYFMDLVLDSNTFFSVGHVIFGAFVLLIIECIFYKKKD